MIETNLGLPTISLWNLEDVLIFAIKVNDFMVEFCVFCGLLEIGKRYNSLGLLFRLHTQNGLRVTSG